MKLQILIFLVGILGQDMKTQGSHTPSANESKGGCGPKDCCEDYSHLTCKALG